MIDESFGVIPLVREEGGFWVLLIHQKHGDFWGFPKGHTDATETRKEAAERELFEEVGLEVFEYLPVPPVIQKYIYKSGSHKIEKRVELYPAITSNEYTVCPDEVIEAKWVPLDEAEEMITYPEGRESIKDLRRRLKSC
jgi:8-oxo-(d)GTP phosphatase